MAHYLLFAWTTSPSLAGRYCLKGLLGVNGYYDQQWPRLTSLLIFCGVFGLRAASFSLLIY